VRYATISHDGRHAGRGGSGAVLGSKNLKAIAFAATSAATGRILASSSHSAAICRSARSVLPPRKYRELGTASNMLGFNRFGTLPTRNFQSGSFEDAARLSPEDLRVPRGRARAGCVACTIGASTSTARTVCDWSTRACLRSARSAASATLRRCWRRSADATTSASTRSAPAARLRLPWSASTAAGSTSPGCDSATRTRLCVRIDLIGRGEGLGCAARRGQPPPGAQIGHDSIAFAPQVKGLELPGYEPRALQTMALGFAVAARGADHNRSGAYEVDFSEKVDRRHATLENVRFAIETEDKAALMDSLILCKFLRGVFDDFHVEVADILRSSRVERDS
jgi:aldehyde:ferredoxin oxidoreductase